MRSIKRLPEAVHSSVRSGIILFDFTRVVEELIFNSLDAGASKISVAVAVGTCYIKVVDDGSGITRDGLSFLGERYATSKVDQSADMGIASGSFGFRGEALGSISNISLLEVVTKAHGRPNGYRKVIKACQCLYLGIDDGRQDVGTTVIVRDLFYNQPVRRKHIQSSPRKALHSVKKCVLRIALMHPKVSFKIVDIESEDELLHTSASPSLLSLLTSSFGFEVSNSLHLLNVSDGVLKIYGYISGPSGTFSVKALHYVYINSQYICKGPIHKLLNELASRFNCTVLWKANIGSQNRKQSRSQPYASYILNLVCPRSCYDLTFEPSKTSVEFKDWVPILTFFEKAITQFWSENKSHGGSLCNGTSMSENDIMWKEGDNIVSVEEANDEIAKKRRRIQNNEACSGDVSPLLGMLIEESDHRCDRKNSRLSFYKSHRNVLEFKEKQSGYSYLKSRRNASEFEKHQTGVPVSQNESPSPSCSESLVQYGMTFNRECNRHLWTSDDNIIFSEDNFFRNKFFNTEKSNEHADNILSSTWGDAYRYIGANMNDELKWSELSSEGFKINYDVDKFRNDLKKPLLRSCSSQRRLPTDAASFSSHEGFEFQSDGFRTEQKWLDFDHGVDVGEVDDDDHDIEFLPTASALSSPKLIAKSDMHRDLSFLSRNSNKFLAVGEGFAEENEFTPDPVKQTVGPSNPSLDFEQSPATSDPLFGTKPWDVEPFIDYNALERCNNNDNISIYNYGADRKGNDCIFGSDMQNSSSRRSCFSSSFRNIKSEIDSEDDISRIPERHDLPDVFSPKFSDSFTFEAEWLSSVSCGNNFTNNCAPTPHLIAPSIYLDKYENQRDQFIHKEEKYVCKRRPRRSHSAPPVYKGRKKFFALNNHWALESGKANAPTIHEAPVLGEASDLKHPQQSSVVFHQHSKLSSVRASSFYGRPDMKEMPDIFGIQKHGVRNKTQGLHIYNVDSVEDFTSKEIHDSLDSQLKWGKGSPQTTNGGRQLNLNNQDSILNISSGLLHLSGDSLVPESISKHCLEDAKVLQQVDRKFIPVVASGVLAIIDQHAADERIRLEELRQKVLSGEMKTITYLDTEKELLALPEIGYQLLHNYAEQIQYWGWICNIHAHGSKSFKKNLKLLHRQPSIVTLLAVPCILGVNLTDTDLLEFLQQLADTDGSSTLPPSVLRILNFKACRGAIMFGDALLPSECSLIVEELKQTALCFQCAHGRPTTAPLVNLGALHKQISKLQLWNDGSKESWHGLRRGKVSVGRAAQRLSGDGVNVE